MGIHLSSREHLAADSGGLSGSPSGLLFQHILERTPLFKAQGNNHYNDDGHDIFCYTPHSTSSPGQYRYGICRSGHRFLVGSPG